MSAIGEVTAFVPENRLIEGQESPKTESRHNRHVHTKSGLPDLEDVHLQGRRGF